MKGSTKRIVSILISLVLFIAAISIYSSYVVPEYNRVNELRAEAASKQTTLDSQREVVNQVSTLLMKYRSIPDLRSALGLVLPTTEDTASIFAQVFAAANESGVGIQQFGVSTNIGNRSTGTRGNDLIKSVSTAQVSLYLVAGYSAFKEFLKILEYNLRVMDVVSLKVQPVSKTGQDGYFFNVTINTYYQGI